MSLSFQDTELSDEWEVVCVGVCECSTHLYCNVVCVIWCQTSQSTSTDCNVSATLQFL